MYSGKLYKVTNSFHAFGMPVFDMTLQNFLDVERWDVFRFGRKPVAIYYDKVKGMDFDEAFQESEVRNIDNIAFALSIIII
jgi:hypothetical protein